ncbi:MAG TPA: GNAT family N-acetyltransferase [Stackebrandtia sp.]|jgi:GNAT superfamily N-acetyltransferase|uniref:GNAT family N-acetyltransferase n=1 Tax=Stackebrandtia sp. TaxID=2023065 RepID=UPI002D2CCBAA|nr:GNAT family N-acetyltransferase [Stackebrandtia sp.]HZE41081.1 GNAT family N-acetyltransferase [Stackebrandtia sp.]
MDSPATWIDDTVEVRRLGPEWLGACLDLAADRQWPREERKWRLLFDVGEVYGIVDPGGELVSAAVLTRYGDGLCAISMVLTASRLEGRGLGRRVMTRLLGEAGDAVVTLYATDNGLPLYQKLGFTAVDANTTHVGRLDAPSAGRERCRVATDADLPAIAALDARVCGGDRGGLVARLPRFADQLRVIETDGEITGYASAWPNLTTTVVGPVIAANLDDARALVADLARGTTHPIRLEVLDAFAELGRWAESHGAAARARTTFMVHNGRPIPGEPEHLYSPVSVALG